MKSELKQPEPQPRETVLTLTKDEVYRLRMELLRHVNPYVLRTGEDRRSDVLVDLVKELAQAQLRYQ